MSLDPNIIDPLFEKVKTTGALAGVGTWLYLLASAMLRRDKITRGADRRLEDTSKTVDESYTKTIAMLQAQVDRMDKELSDLRDRCPNCYLYIEEQQRRHGAGGRASDSDRGKSKDAA
jgi:hypothetical protein